MNKKKMKTPSYLLFAPKFSIIIFLNKCKRWKCLHFYHLDQFKLVLEGGAPISFADKVCEPSLWQNMINDFFFQDLLLKNIC